MLFGMVIGFQMPTLVYLLSIGIAWAVGPASDPDKTA